MEHAKKYIKGLFQSGKRNIERMNEVVPETEYESMRHFISESPWDHRPVLDKVAHDGSELFFNCGKVALLLDESGHLKKGKMSVGVSKQYSGQAGKVENCQVAVYAGLSCHPFYALIDAELYLPESWTKDEKRCQKAGVPAGRIKHKTKGELAYEIVERQKSLGTRFDWVGGDGFYGHDYQLGKKLDELGQLFVFEAHSNQMVYLSEPVISLPGNGAPSKGRAPKRYKADVKPVEARSLVFGLEPTDWEPVLVRHGSKGGMRAEIYVRTVYVWDHKEEKARQRQLVIRRTYSKSGAEEIKYALSNAEQGQFTNLELAQMLSERYFIERAFQDAKQELGMSEYQVRGWLAWHHHIALVMMSMMFITREKVQFNVQKPLLSAYDVREVIIRTYARKGTTIEEINEQMKVRHRQRAMDQLRNLT